MKTPRLILVLVASAATAFAVDPPPGGGYQDGSISESDDALFGRKTARSSSQDDLTRPLVV